MAEKQINSSFKLQDIKEIMNTDGARQVEGNIKAQPILMERKVTVVII